MNKQYIFGLFLLFSLVACAQEHSKFNTLLNQLKHDLKIYNEIPYYGFDDIALKNVGLTDADIKEILEPENKKKYKVVSADTIGHFGLIFYLQKKIILSVNELTQFPRFFDNDIINSFANTALRIVKSDDGKLYNFSIDEKTGGSYHARVSWMYYTDMNTYKEYWTANVINEELPKIFTVFEGDGYNNIYTLNTKEGVKYVLTGSYKGCSYCFMTYVQLVKFDGNKFVDDFSYQILLRDPTKGVTYNPKTKTITVDYITDDLTQRCECENQATAETTSENEGEIEGEIPEIPCYCEFVFNGNNFELKK
jgi:hypothetical protein